MINHLYANVYNSHMGPAIDGFSGLGFGFMFFAFFIIFIFIATILLLKGYALWNAARRGDAVWFVIILLINTMGIIELIYLIAVVGKFRNLDCKTCGKCGVDCKCEKTNEPEKGNTHSHKN